MRALSMPFSTFAECPGTTRALLLIGLLILSGCGDGKVARYPVAGTVLVDGLPAKGAIVVFCPVSASPEADRLRPAGRTDAAGKFSLTTIEADDGAPAGDYKVLVQWPDKPPAAVGRQDDRSGQRPPDRLNGKYYNLERSQLTATIKEENNELPPFELQSK